MKAQARKIYWEKQGIDQLCGVHTINNLLQGPFFNQIQLAQIALDLDKKEKQLMMQQGMTNQFLKYMAQDSGNVAMSGNYSIQVLQEALKKFKLSMQSIDVMEKSIDLTTKTGFICHSADHWFALRKIQNVWYNLNSCNKRLPEIISEFYMSAFLISVKQNGYQIFLVEGEYPQSNQDMFQYYNKNQIWYNPLRILRYHQKKMKKKNYSPNIMGASQDTQLKKAIAASLGKQINEQPSSGEDSDWQNLKKKQVKVFGGEANKLSGFFQVQYEKFFINPDDVQMISFIKMSLEDYFGKQPSVGFIVSFRYSSGKKERRVFAKDARVQNLYDWVWLKGHTQNSKFYLVHMGSKEPLLELGAPLQLLADEDNEISINVAQQS